MSEQEKYHSASVVVTIGDRRAEFKRVLLGEDDNPDLAALCLVEYARRELLARGLGAGIREFDSEDEQ